MKKKFELPGLFSNKIEFNFGFVALLSLAACLTGCGNRSVTEPKSEVVVSQGGEDAGAGNTELSSREAVHKAVEQAWSDLTTDSFLRQLDTAISTTSFVDSDLNIDDFFRMRKVGETIFYHQTIKKLKNGRELSVSGDWRGTAYLKLSKIEMKEVGPCKALGNSHGDASVEKFEHGARICVSVENLMRFPRASLRFETLGLLVHEIAHLNGMEEADATLLQKATVLVYYNEEKFASYWFKRAHFRKTRDALRFAQASFKKTVEKYCEHHDDKYLFSLNKVLDDVTRRIGEAFPKVEIDSNDYYSLYLDIAENSYIDSRLGLSWNNEYRSFKRSVQLLRKEIMTSFPDEKTQDENRLVGMSLISHLKQLDQKFIDSELSFAKFLEAYDEKLFVDFDITSDDDRMKPVDLDKCMSNLITEVTE